MPSLSFTVADAKKKEEWPPPGLRCASTGNQYERETPPVQEQEWARLPDAHLFTQHSRSLKQEDQEFE